jgi:D-alanyl-D-alanine dipeptidase
LLLAAAACHQTQEEQARADAASVNTPELPVAPTGAADSLLVDVQTLDSTIRVDARYAGSDNFTGAPLPGYEAPRALLRREAARALTRVQDRLRKQGLSLLVYDGYRPVRATLAMVRWAERSGRRSLLTHGYIASRSRHNLGLAVDLTIVNPETGAPLDMGTPFDTFSESAHTANAEGGVLTNRRTLVRAMEAEGFRNYDKEWWHFSLDVPGALPFDRVIR